MLATFQGVGKVLASTVGPGPTPGSERAYLSFVHYGESLEIVSVDPTSGAHEVFRSPVPTETGAWALELGPDGRLYVGTFPNGHVLRLDPATGRFQDLGRPASSENYIWQFTTGTDGHIYGCTYPSAKLVSVDPTTGRLSDLGQLDPAEKYARFITASADGFVYVGTGSKRAGIVAYEIATGEKRLLTPPGSSSPGFGRVHVAAGKVYGAIGDGRFTVEGVTLSEVSRSQWLPSPKPTLESGHSVEVTSKAELLVTAADGRVMQKHRFDYVGGHIQVFRLGLGPDGLIYGSTLMPNHFFRVDPRSGELSRLGTLGDGEIYSFAGAGSKLYAAIYAGTAPLVEYDPGRAFAPSSAKGANPWLLYPEPRDDSWRPMAMLPMPDGSLLIGAIPGYGRVDGIMGLLRPGTGAFVPLRNAVPSQSVVSLALANGLVVGGTDVSVGLGAEPTSSDAEIFVWDPKTGDVVHRLVPVPGAKRITNLVEVGGGIVYGFAGPDVLFAYDVQELRVIRESPVPFEVGQASTYNSIGRDAEGTVWGVAADGVFRVEPSTGKASLITRVPRRITAGFALSKEGLFFATGPVIWKYRLPKATDGSPHEKPVDDVGRTHRGSEGTHGGS